MEGLKKDRDTYSKMSIFLNRVKLFCRNFQSILNLPDLGAGHLGGIFEGVDEWSENDRLKRLQYCS